MLKHTDIWNAIDRLAQEHGMSPSGLARRAGLDPTTFNKSKRVTREGKLRWPSTESVAKILTATGASLGEFVSYVGTAPGAGAGVFRNLPMLPFSEAGSNGYFDEAGRPVGNGWDEIPYPDLGDPHAYALEVTDDAMEPVYRDGDIIIISPQAGIRRGDRVVLRTRSGPLMLRVLRRRTARVIELDSCHGNRGMEQVPVDDVTWIGRIVWASQ